MPLTVQDGLNQANPNLLPDWNRKINMGDFVAGMIPTSKTRTGLADLAAHVHDVASIIQTVTLTTTNQTIISGLDTPASGEVAIVYDSEGVATLTFSASNTGYIVTEQILPVSLGTNLAENI